MKELFHSSNSREVATRLTRRDALFGLAAGAISLGMARSLLPQAAAAASEAQRKVGEGTREFLFFSKPFQSLSFDELGALAADCGFTGLEFPVRPGGHIEPDRVEAELPQAVAAFRKHGIDVPLIASGINEVSREQQTEKVLRTAAANGIRYFRMAYYRYDFAKPVRTQLKEFASKFNDLVAAAADLGIKPLYQNHSGSRYVGAPLWDIYSLLEQHSPKQVGLAYDIGHALVEGFNSWQIDFGLIRDYLDVAYIKDPVWSIEQKTFGWAPVGSGLIPPAYFALLDRIGFTGPLSIHVEYLDHRDPASDRLFRKAIRDDLQALRTAIAA